MVTVQYKERLDLAKIRQVAEASKVGDINITTESAIGGGGEHAQDRDAGGQVPASSSTPCRQAYPQAGLVKAGEEHVGASIGRRSS